MFDNRLDCAILAGGVATFDDDKDTLAALNHAALQLDELDLQPDQQRVIPMRLKCCESGGRFFMVRSLLVASLSRVVAPTRRCPHIRSPPTSGHVTLVGSCRTAKLMLCLH
jgi:hypothetical protein